MPKANPKPRIDRVAWMAANRKPATTPASSWWLEDDFYARQHEEQRRMMGASDGELKLDAKKQQDFSNARLLHLVPK